MGANGKVVGDSTQQKSLKQSANDNPSMLGDPTSLKAETSDSRSRENDRELPESTAIPESSDSPEQERSGSTGQQHKSLKEAAKENVTMLGDPVSLKAETSDSEPTPDDRGARSSSSAEDVQQQKRLKSKI